jgi:regulatory protein YycH of two-component signal transduction system YycFG
VAMGIATGADAYVYWNGQHVGSLISAEQPTEKPTLETTTLGVSDRTFVSSRLRSNTFSGTLFYDPNDSSSVSLISAIDENNATDGTLRIEWIKNTGNGAREGTAIVTSRGAAVSVGDLLRISISVQFTGAVSGSF